MHLNKFVFESFLSFLPFQQLSVFSSEFFLATGNETIEEIKVKRVNKKSNLVVNGYCDSLGILPLVLVGAGLAIGGGSSGSGSTSSNLIN